jgi:CRP-like cAMP-binding protein
MLDLLPEAEFAALLAGSERSAFASGTILYEPKEHIRQVYFPTSCVLSVVTVMRDGSAVEIGTYGCEGMSGAAVVLGAEIMPSKMLCQVPGDAISTPVSLFSSIFEQDSALRLYCKRYTRALFNFMGQSVACNRLHDVTERCARWLALTHDRVPADNFLLTQEFLAIMLGVHRPSVSSAASALQEAGLIRYSRGQVTIVDRKGLEEAACECYQIGADEFERVFRPIKLDC